MKFAIKSIVAVAALVAGGAASAVEHGPWEFVSGTGGLTFSQAALDALAASGAFILTEGAGNKASYDEASGNVGLEFTAGTAVGNDIKTLTSTGSSVVIERTVVQGKTVKFDSTITLTDFVFDLGTKTLSAGLTGTNLLTGAVTEYGFNAIYSASGLNGGNIVEGAVAGGFVSGTAAGNTTGAFSINLATADKFLTILGLPLTGGVADLVKNADWGVATANGNVQAAAVPEPSAYLSALAGIAILGVARLRKQKSA